MIAWVWQQVTQCSAIQQTVIATDDTRIAQAVEMFGGRAIMTNPEHPSGTDRVWEAWQALDPDHLNPKSQWILNVQGDEPLIEPELLTQLTNTAQAYPDVDIITAVTPFTSAQEWDSPNCVKAVTTTISGVDNSETMPVHRAHYFSRSQVPHQAWEHWCENTPPRLTPLRHLGVYLYRVDALKRFVALSPSPLEQLERLEQLRAIEAGMSILAVETERAPIGIDTPEDLARVEKNYSPVADIQTPSCPI